MVLRHQGWANLCRVAEQNFKKIEELGTIPKGPNL
ncbi:MAG: hypothetical protein JWR09_3572 [Mucilaginibacter sp.]|nr:hypothetical protein [Mucilaginibacter sp.]